MFNWNSTPRVKKRLAELEERCAKLEGDIHALQLDWENTYDKVRQMMGRIAKRAEAMHDQAEDENRLYPLGDNNGGALPTSGFLTPRQKQVQQQILRRRASLPHDRGE